MSQGRAPAWAVLEPWLNDPEVSEIMVNGHDNIFLERSHRLVKVATPFRDDDHVLEVIRSIAEPLGRRIDESQPMVDARLPDGARVNAVIPPISLTGPTLTIRKFRTKKLTIEDMVRFGALSEQAVTFLRACVRGRLNIVFTGGTGSGKTTTLSCILEMIPDEERIILIQNAGEIPISKKRLVKLESRPPNVEGKGEVTIRALVSNAMHMRPDRIILGDLRGGEALEILRAMDTGHDGSMFSILATSPRDVLGRLEMVMLLADPALPVLSMRQQMASAIDLIVCQERVRDGSRKIVNITEVKGMEGDVIVMQDIFAFKETGFREGRVQGYLSATGIVPEFFNRFREMGIELPMELFAPQ